MGKGADPNCDKVFPMEVGEEEILVQPKVDKVRIKRLEGGLALVGFEPGSSEGERFSFITTAEGYETLATSPEPTVAARDDKSIPRFYPLTPNAEDFLRDQPFETGPEWDLFEDPATVVREGRLDPEHLYRFGWEDYTFYRIGKKEPLTRPYHLELWSTYVDVDKALEALKDHPYVLSAEIKNNPVGQNWDISGRRLLHVVMRMPQEDHDKWYEHCVEKEGYVSPHYLQGALNYGSDDEKLPEGLRDIDFKSMRYERERDSPDYEELTDPWW